MKKLTDTGFAPQPRQTCFKKLAKCQFDEMVSWQIIGLGYWSNCKYPQSECLEWSVN
jgi:hypothetical protein